MLLDSGSTVMGETSLLNGPGDDDPIHAVCCEQDWAICGLDVRDADWAEEDDENLLCLDCELIIEGLRLWSCPFCGKEWIEE